MVGIEVFLDPFLYVLFAVGFLGMVVHWLKRFLRKQSPYTFTDWLWNRHKRYTIYAILTYCGAFWVFMLAGFNGMELAHWTTAFLMGYTIDSAINEDLQKRVEVNFDDFDEPNQ